MCKGIVVLLYWNFRFLFRQTHDAGNKKNAYYEADEDKEDGN